MTGDVGLDVLTPQLVVVRGPAVEARQWARAWVAHSPRIRVRVCQDDLADMMCARRGDQPAARIVAAARDGAIQALLHRGVSVIVDGTDITDTTVARLESVAWTCAAKAEVVDLRGPPR